MLGNSDLLFFLLEGLDHCNRYTLLYHFLFSHIPYPINDKCMYGNCSTIFNFLFSTEHYGYPAVF